MIAMSVKDFPLPWNMFDDPRVDRHFANLSSPIPGPKKIHHLPPALPDCCAFSSSQCWVKRLPSPLTNCSPMPFLRASKLRFHWNLIFLNIFRVYDGLWWSMMVYDGLWWSMMVYVHLLEATSWDHNLSLVGGWALPLWKMMEFVSWDDDIPTNYMESHKSHVPNHQPVPVTLIHGVATERRFLQRLGSPGDAVDPDIFGGGLNTAVLFVVHSD